MDMIGLTYTAYVLEKTQTSLKYKQIASGYLTDTRFADDNMFNLVEVANLINSMPGYSAWTTINDKSVKLNIEDSKNTHTFTASASTLTKGGLFGVCAGGLATSNIAGDSGFYFGCYKCINKKYSFYINLGNVAVYLGKTIVIINQDDPPKLENGKTFVLGGSATAQLAWRFGISVGIGWDGQGNFGTVKSVSIGAGAIGLDAGAFAAMYNTESLSNISGYSFDIGIGGDIPTPLGSLGLNYTKSLSLDGNNISGHMISGSVGVTILPVSSNVSITLTTVTDYGVKALLKTIVGKGGTRSAVIYGL